MTVKLNLSAVKLMGHPAKLSAIQDSMRGIADVDLTMPVSIELHLTDICNASCPWCVESEMRSHRTLDCSLVLALCEELAAAGTAIVFDGGGEPTLHPEFERIVSFCRERHIPMGLITNGIAFPVDLASSFRWIRFSVDSGSREGYRVEKGVDCWDDVWQRVESASRSSCGVVGVSYVLTRRNMEEVCPFVSVAARSGAAYAYIRPVEDHPELVPRRSELEACRGNIAATAARGIPVVWRGTERLAGGNDGLPCYAHSVTAVVRTDGNVFVCERRSPSLKLGSLEESGFGRIWSSDTRLRAARRVASASDCAQHCRVCRLTSINRMLYDIEHCTSREFL